MPNKSRSLPLKPTLFLIYLLPALLNLSPSSSWAMERVSLKTHPDTGIVIANPMEIEKLPNKKTYQVNHEAFTLQFFFNEKDIFGIILKRDKSRPIHFRWCFLRNCEETQYDYHKIIAQPLSPPFEQGFFTIPNPFYLPYSFQGLEFSSPK